MQTSIRRTASLDVSFVEDALDFVVQDDIGRPQQFCLAMECHDQTLNRVVATMLSKPDYQRKPELRKRYIVKACLVLRQLAKSLCHLHASGVVHADVCLENCAKFGDTWKLANTMGIQRLGTLCDPLRLGESAPPESIHYVHDGPTNILSRKASFKKDLTVQPSVDVWAFGKLAYETLVGEPLLDFDTRLETKHDTKALVAIMNWNKTNMNEVRKDLFAIGLPKSGIELVIQCLSPKPQERPDMDQILSHPFWSEMRQRHKTGLRKFKA